MTDALMIHTPRGDLYCYPATLERVNAALKATKHLSTEALERGVKPATKPDLEWLRHTISVFLRSRYGQPDEAEFTYGEYNTGVEGMAEGLASHIGNNWAMIEQAKEALEARGIPHD